MIDQLDAVGQTAVGVARSRAIESAGESPLFVDPLASWIAHHASTGQYRNRDELDDADRRALFQMHLWIVARTVFLDEICTAATADGVDQLVILGVGLDARSFRLDLHDTTVYELDRPHVLEVREGLLAESGLTPAAHRVPVAGDLTADWTHRLSAAGFDPARPSVWLAEGLFAYLGADVVTGVLTEVDRLSAPGSRLGATLRAGRSGAATSPGQVFGDVATLWHEPGDVPGQLASMGWTATLSEASDVLTRVGRIGDGNATGRRNLLSAVRPR